MKLDPDGFARARTFLEEEARPLERAIFRRAFEGASIGPALEELTRFRNDDGGFGHGLEPDLWLPASSVLCTTQGLHVLQELGVPTSHELVTGAVDWLVEAFDPKLGAWRSVTQEAEEHPHAGHWNWALHADGTKWPVRVLPHAEVLTHLWRSAERVPRELLEAQTDAFVADFATSDSAGGDGVARCERFVRTERAPEAARRAVAERMNEAGAAIVSRDPAEWTGYVAKPLKLAPDPDCVLAKPLAALVEQNLDFEIEHQEPDGSWAPSWSWNGAYPDAWALAERQWRGDVTLHTLASLRAYRRIEAGA